MNAARIEVYEDVSGEWRWRLRARNGRIIATPQESYRRKSGAFRAAETVHDTLREPLEYTEV